MITEEYIDMLIQQSESNENRLDGMDISPQNVSYKLDSIRYEVLDNARKAVLYDSLPQDLVDRKLIPDIKLEFKHNIELRQLIKQLKEDYNFCYYKYTESQSIIIEKNNEIQSLKRELPILQEQYDIELKQRKYLESKLEEQDKRINGNCGLLSLINLHIEEKKELQKAIDEYLIIEKCNHFHGIHTDFCNSCKTEIRIKNQLKSILNVMENPNA